MSNFRGAVQFLWWLFTSFHGIDKEATEIVDLPVMALPDALIAGDIDAAVLWEPWTSRLGDQVDGDLHSLPGSDIYIENWVLVSTRSLVQRHPDALRAILSAYRDAIEFIQASPREALALYVDHSGLKTNGSPTLQDLPLFGLSLDWSLLTALMETSLWARETTGESVDEAPNPLAWIESRPLREIMPTAVGIPADLPDNRIARP